MLKEFKEKYRQLKKSSSHMWGNDSFSFHRLYIFLTSANGQKRILNFSWKVSRYLFRKVLGIQPDQSPYYDRWMQKWFPDPSTLQQYKEESKKFEYTPKMSLLLQSHNSNVGFLEQFVESVINQVYENWELCIDQSNSDPLIKEIIKKFTVKDKRIVIAAGHNDNQVSSNTGAPVSISGEFIITTHHSDLLSPEFLFQVVKYLQQHQNADLIYSDTDKIDENGHHFDPFFKPDWCPDSFLSRNYIGHGAVIRKKIAVESGAMPSALDDNMNYDLLLRVTEHTEHIHHLPLILYHSRVSPFDETRITENNNDVRALEDTLERRKIKGIVSVVDSGQKIYSIRYQVVNHGKVSVIIPSKNRAELCNVAVSSIFNLTDYPDFEVILIDNNSDEPEFFSFLAHWEKKEPGRFRVIKDTGEFNFSRLMNHGVSVATGKYLLLLNNDTEIIKADWMTAMVEQSQFATTGVVGVKLIYKNDTIQHAGVIVGLGGLAGHTFVGFDRDAPGYHNYLRCINNYSALTAACLMVRKEVYDEAGGFDEQLAVEYNDIDFCLKLKEKGLRNIYLPHVEVYHYESISRGHPHKTRKSHRQHLKDVRTFTGRWNKYIQHDPCYNPHLTRIFTDFRLRIQD